MPRRLHWTRLDQCLSCLERVGVWLGCLSSKCREPFDQGHLISNNALRLHYKSERKRDATPLKLQQMLHRVLSIGARQFRIGSQEVTLISQSYSRLSSFSISSATLDHSSIRAERATQPQLTTPIHSRSYRRVSETGNFAKGPTYCRYLATLSKEIF